MTPGLLAALASFFLFLVGHVAVFQLFNIQKRFNAMALMWLALMAAYGILYWTFQTHLPTGWRSLAPVCSVEGVVGILNGAVVYLLLFLIYCCVYFTDHSLSVAYMIELEHRLGRIMTRTELKERFPHDAMLRQRLADLIANRYVVQEGEHYRLDTKGRCLTTILGTLKRFLKLEPGG
jgi:uncharacterized protein with PQ loop repeat